MSELGQAAVGPGGYVSAATIGATVGYIAGPVGIVAGAAIGAVVDVFLSARQKKKMRRKIEKEFMRQLLVRYNTQIFVSSLERLGMAMIYLQSLGLKPGTADFDQMLKKKAYPEIGYQGNCAIDLLGPAPSGEQKPVLASIKGNGEITVYGPHVDMDIGPKWATACKELHKEALKAWAEGQKEFIVLQRETAEEKAAALRSRLTRIMVNSGLIMLLLGYTLRQKKKVKKLREATARIKEQKRLAEQAAKAKQAAEQTTSKVEEK